MGRAIVGIDLGTTNSAVAVWREGKAQLIPNALGHVLTPSVVGLNDQGEVLVGLAARERQSTHPGLTVGTFKRYMGSRRETRLGTRTFLPEELSALVLRSLKADAEAWLGDPVTEAVITVPAYFNDKQRKATQRAGELAGLKVERLLNEPTAAALAYGIHELEAEEDKRFLVFDLGGGTFDVSIIEIFEGVIEVRASTGDNRLGGEDFNDILVEDMRRKFADRWSSLKSDEALQQRLRAAAERARRDLTNAASTVMTVVWNDERFDHEVTVEAFEEASKPLLDRLRAPVLRALSDSNIHVDSLREVVLVGGATRMPIVRRAVARMLGRFPQTSLNPDEAIALGAAVQAGLKARDSALSEVVMTDVCPYTLGVDSAERTARGTIRTGLFSPIIDRNTVIPASRAEYFFTMQDGQRTVEFNIYQGESRQVSDNIHLGSIAIDVPPKRAGEIMLECRFSYDIDGLLEVDVHVPATGATRQTVIVDDQSFSEGELARRRAALAALKVHPKDQDANRAALARAERCFEDALGERRVFVGSLITAFEAALDSQDPRPVDAARSYLLERLDELEGQTWL